METFHRAAQMPNVTEKLFVLCTKNLAREFGATDIVTERGVARRLFYVDDDTEKLGVRQRYATDSSTVT